LRQSPVSYQTEHAREFLLSHHRRKNAGDIPYKAIPAPSSHTGSAAALWYTRRPRAPSGYRFDNPNRFQFPTPYPRARYAATPFDRPPYMVAKWSDHPRSEKQYLYRLGSRRFHRRNN